ncbi:hypothetical protein MJD09_25610 [bacterium]|nr:hypothetical protein [bacterium]
MMSTNLESYYQRLVTGLHLKALQGREKVTLKDLLANPLPEIFLASAKIYAQITFEKETPFALNGHGRYDFCYVDQLKEKMKPLKEALLLATILTDDEVGQLSDFSARLQLDIYLRPRQALTTQLFKSKNVKLIEDVIIVAEGFDTDRPFVQKLIGFAESWQPETISRDQFEDVARRLEQKTYKETPVSALLKDMNLLLEFQHAILADASVVQTQVLLAMLQNRNLNGMFDEISRYDVDKRSWSLDEVEHALERFLLVGPMESSESTGPAKTRAPSLGGRLPKQAELGDWDSFNGFEDDE